VARQDPQLTSFNGGELSPWLRGRVDVARYATGCERLFNMIARVQGPAVRRTGTEYAAPAKQNGDVFLFGFEANTGSITVIEAGPNYLRFFDAGTRYHICDFGGGNWQPANPSFGPPAELATPWGTLYNTTDATPRLQTAQSNDVMWIVHPTVFPQKLSRVAPYRFTLANLFDGHNVPVPFKDVNPTNTIVITASATGGVGITLTASAAYFTSSMQGEYFYLEQPLTDNVLPWETNKAVAVGDFRRSDGRNYIAGTAGTTGTVKPTHSTGSKNDGGVVWTFFDDGFGVVGLTTINSPTSATVTVGIQLPKSVVTLGTTRFARQAWNNDEGFPNAIALFRERLCFARGQTIWCSVSGDYENFQRYQQSGQTAPDLAIVLTIAAEKNDRVLWLSSQSRLLAGTASSVWSVGEASTQDVFGPGNVSAHPSTSVGCNGTVPIKVGESVLCVKRGGTRLLELRYDFQIDDYAAIDISQYAEHIPAGINITQLAFAALPDPIVWCIGAKVNTLSQIVYAVPFAGFTFDRANQVGAWHQHQLGGGLAYGSAVIAGLVSVTAPDKVNTDVWFATARIMPSGTIKYLEVMGPAKGTVPYTALTQDPTDACYLDFSGFASVASGDDHATPVPWIPVGEPATGLINGAVASQASIDSEGFPCLPSVQPSSRQARVGYNYLSDLKPMALVGGSAVGAAPGKVAKVIGFTVRIHNSGSFLYGYSDENEPTTQGIGNSILYRREMRNQTDSMDNAVLLKSGDFLVRPEHGTKTLPRIFIRQDQPLPLNVLAIFPRIETQDEG